MLRRGSAGSNTAADHLALLDAAITALPPGFRRKLMVTADGAGASHTLIARLDTLAALYRFRTRCGCGELVFGPMSWLRQDRGLCPFACST